MRDGPSPAAQAQAIAANVAQVIIGKDRAIAQSLAALLAEGHILVEDVPGVGKTMLARALAVSTGCRFQRIQFTPDLLPSDLTGVSIYNQRSGEFHFRPGPVMAQVVLADEINRATPKTQSALLEAMEERQVSADGETHRLAPPFMVLATQNPVEYEGTFPLPEAQLDRFLLRLSLGYPDRRQELAVIEGQERRHPIEDLPPVSSAAGLIELQAAAREIYVDPAVREYIVALTAATREHEDIALGASPRASLGLFRLARGLCAGAGARLCGARRCAGTGGGGAGPPHHPVAGRPPAPPNPRRPGGRTAQPPARTPVNSITNYQLRITN